MRVIPPPGARPRVAEVVPVDASEDILDDPDVRFETVRTAMGARIEADPAGAPRTLAAKLDR